jgi:hypothetical protein
MESVSSTVYETVYLMTSLSGSLKTIGCSRDCPRRTFAMHQPLQHRVSNPLERLHLIRYIRHVTQYVDLVESNQFAKSTFSDVDGDNIRRASVVVVVVRLLL